MKVAFITSEVTPFAKTGGMADVCAALPVALEKIGVDVCVALPQYASVASVVPEVEKINDVVSRARLGEDIPVFLIRHDHYFDRAGLYGDREGDYSDNLLRFHYFCDQALAALKTMEWDADILHCHDWQTSLIPASLRYRYRTDAFWKKTKTVLTIHNLAYQGKGQRSEFDGLGFDTELFNENLFEFYDQINLLKAGILTTDRITTVSPQYAQEIQTSEFGCGLEGVLGKRRNDIVGILNGIDQQVWNPQTDPVIHKNYTAREIRNKALNKEYLQQKTQLAHDPEIPLYGFIGRLSHQKGIDLLAEILPLIGRENIQVVILGDGERKYEQMLREASAHFPDRIAFFMDFNEELAHQIYAGCDILLMPSRYEPCGLNQMIALRYGVIPLVYRTGGLADTIIPHSQNGNGFVFDSYTPTDFRESIINATRVYHNKELFEPLMLKAMSCDFSWDVSARAYRDLYQQLLS